mmetsp:Transcript_79992/g.259259  ORF Transcript_79992/g.259259 Transcript_79992/m.259259 type:complete len:292 (-) Transcript_79992:369-1244(-)
MPPPLGPPMSSIGGGPGGGGGPPPCGGGPAGGPGPRTRPGPHPPMPGAGPPMPWPIGPSCPGIIPGPPQPCMPTGRKGPPIIAGIALALGMRFFRSSSSLFVIISSACVNMGSGPEIRAIWGPPGEAAGNTEMCTCVPAFALKSLMVEPPGPIRPPTRSAETWSSLGAPGAAVGPPASAWVPAGKAGRAPGGSRPASGGGIMPGGEGPPGGGMRAKGMPGGWPGGGGTPPPIGQPFIESASLIIASVISMSPTMVKWPVGSFGPRSILISALLLCRMSCTVSPPLPMSARI